jgi:hypothetical protein
LQYKPYSTNNSEKDYADNAKEGSATECFPRGTTPLWMRTSGEVNILTPSLKKINPKWKIY